MYIVMSVYRYKKKLFEVARLKPIMTTVKTGLIIENDFKLYKDKISMY